MILSRHDPDELEPALRSRGYTLGMCLGGGLFGDVFECTRDGRSLAVKVCGDLKLEVLQKLVREVRIQIYFSDVGCPYLLPLLDFFIEPERGWVHPGCLPHKLFFVMPRALCDMETVLRHWAAPHLPSELKAAWPPPLRHAVEARDPRLAQVLCAHVAAALSILHAAGVLHRNIKPDNVLLVEDPTAEFGVVAALADFGWAKEACSIVTPEVAPPTHRAPEITACLPYDGGIDVWAFGVVVAEWFKPLVPGLVEVPPFAHRHFPALSMYEEPVDMIHHVLFGLFLDSAPPMPFDHWLEWAVRSFPADFLGLQWRRLFLEHAWRASQAHLAVTQPRGEPDADPPRQPRSGDADADEEFDRYVRAWQGEIAATTAIASLKFPGDDAATPTPPTTPLPTALDPNSLLARSLRRGGAPPEAAHVVFRCLAWVPSSRPTAAQLTSAEFPWVWDVLEACGGERGGWGVAELARAAAAVSGPRRYAEAAGLPTSEELAAYRYDAEWVGQRLDRYLAVLADCAAVFSPRRADLTAPIAPPAGLAPAAAAAAAGVEGGEVEAPAVVEVDDVAQHIARLDWPAAPVVPKGVCQRRRSTG